jgi:hypothetical protein
MRLAVMKGEGNAMRYPARNNEEAIYSDSEGI